jgi:hypothetical protein
LLYKDTADIYMTANDLADYEKELDYNDFGNTYFASRRVLAAAGWEIPALGDNSHGLFLQGIAQFDLNDRDQKLHTQYLSLRVPFSPDPVFDLSLGGLAGYYYPGIPLGFRTDKCDDWAIQAGNNHKPGECTGGGTFGPYGFERRLYDSAC